MSAKKIMESWRFQNWSPSSIFLTPHTSKNLQKYTQCASLGSPSSVDPLSPTPTQGWTSSHGIRSDRQHSPAPLSS